MTHVFADTVGLLALWDTSDQWHEAAAVAFRKILSSRCTIWTSTFVLLECGNAAARRPYRLAVDRLRVELSGAGTLVTPAESDWVAAWTAFAIDTTDTAGIVDHVSFVLMRRLGISVVFSNDRHFRTRGFETLF